MFNFETIMTGSGKTLAALAVAGGLFCSCTVKEDRVPCPCFLNVGFTDRESVPEGAEVDLLGWNGAEMFKVGIDIAEHDPYWVRGVHKGFFDFSAYRGVDKVKDTGHHVTITPGEQADSLYAYHTEVDATGDMAFVDVTFRKQFCTVFLDIQRKSGDLSDFRFLVEGNTCGFDVLNFEAVAGTFRYEPKAKEGSRVVDFRIPRQVDDSMTVALWRLDENGQYQDIGMFPLGKYIMKTGYDWKAEELQDVYILIDLVLGHVTISVDGWEDGAVFTFVEQ